MEVRIVDRKNALALALSRRARVDTIRNKADSFVTTQSIILDTHSQYQGVIGNDSTVIEDNVLI
jgi:hypothetical protein